MSNATAPLIRKPYGKGGRDIHLPVDGGADIWEGTLVSQLTATGMLVPGSTAGSGPAVGMAVHSQSNSAGADGAKRVVVETDRIFSLANGTDTDAVSEATLLFSNLYMVDDHTVADNSAGGTRQVAGIFMGMNEEGTVRVLPGPMAFGASGASAGVGGDQFGDSSFSLYDLREVTSGGDVANIAANGGVLASDTTPILRGDAAESQEVSWAAGNSDVVACHCTLPVDFDGSGDVTVDLYVYTDNAGGGGIEAATFTVETAWDGGTVVVDTATDTVPAVTVHKITATVATADVPDAAANLTMMLTPGTHANDPVQLVGFRVNYLKRA